MVNGKTARKQRSDRAAALESLKRAQAKDLRRKRILTAAGALLAVALAGTLITLALIKDPPLPDREDIQVSGAQVFEGLSANHVPDPVDYGQVPPVGGDHSPVWLNCGVYSQPVPDENAVHSLEHGAVWITYDPARTEGDAAEDLRRELPETYVVLSPLEGTPSPIMVSAWGAQVGIESADDSRLDLFIKKYWQSPQAPEPGAACTGGTDAPGRVA